jgi:hypothetical protein
MSIRRNVVVGDYRVLDVRFFFRRYRDDALTLLASIVVYAVSARFVKEPWLLFGLSVGISVLAAIVIVTLKARRRGFIWLSMRGRHHGEGWIGQGGFSYTRIEHGYRITQSHDGVILAHTLAWSDYCLRFMFRLENASLGVIVRAANLGNLVMLQVFVDRIKAHIRVNGAWLNWDRLPSLSFGAPLALGVWYGCEMSCDKRNVRITINGAGEERPVLNWAIPAGMVVLGSGGPEISGTLTTPFAVNYDYGAIGFRNDGVESALVRHILVERL